MAAVVAKAVLVEEAADTDGSNGTAPVISAGAGRTSTGPWPSALLDEPGRRRPGRVWRIPHVALRLVLQEASPLLPLRRRHVCK